MRNDHFLLLKCKQTRSGKLLVSSTMSVENNPTRSDVPIAIPPDEGAAKVSMPTDEFVEVDRERDREKEQEHGQESDGGSDEPQPSTSLGNSKSDTESK